MLYILFTYLLTVPFAAGFDGPLFLTPYIEGNKIDDAQKLATVDPRTADGKRSFSGYLTVDKSCRNHLFFWYVEAENDPTHTAPVILWLNGGPGFSSLFGMFTEVGPFNHLKDKGFVENQYRWTKDNHVIFLDQPVGVGFSFTEKEECHKTTLEQTIPDVYEAVQQYFTLFPHLQTRRFFIAGESFGGHYIPALALNIHEKRASARVNINLIGVIIGNPWIDATCHHYGAFLYQLGIYDEQLRDYSTQVENKMAEESTKGNLTGAILYYKQLHKDGLPLSHQTFPSFYNVLYDRNAPYDFQEYVTSCEVRKQIHVGNTPYSVESDAVFDQMNGAMFVPSTSYIERLLDTGKYTVGFYGGQLDVICLYPSLPCVLLKLRWSGAEAYRAANRSNWYDGGRLAGWVRVADNLWEAAVRDAGHMVPTDQPRAALTLLSAALRDDPGHTLLSTLDYSP